jgi:PIN domain nuclease of toxin-antitoxin system
MVDIIALTKFLTPFLPYLLKLGDKAAEETAKKLGVDAWEKAKAIWTKLRPQVQLKPATQEAVEDVAKSPNDEDAQAALRQQLKKLLNEDSALASEIGRFFKEAEQTGIVASVVASGERAAALGNNAQGNITITGDSTSLGNGDLIGLKTSNPS